MRPMPDPFLRLQGRSVRVAVDGRKILGRLISIRDGFLTIEPDHGRRIVLNQYEISSIEESRKPGAGAV